MDKDARTRKRRACDQCRKAKSKCEEAGSRIEDDTCRNCLMSGLECEYLEPVRKRGPPKGYMGALEQRLSNAEALLGTLVCSNDPRATSIVADLVTDTLASSILSRIREGQYGLGGRLAQQQLPSTSTDGSRYTFAVPQDESLKPKLDAAVFTAPSLEWQDCLNIHLAMGAKKRDASLQASLKEVTSAKDPDDDDVSMSMSMSKASTQGRKEDPHLVPEVHSKDAEDEEDELMSDENEYPMRDKALFSSQKLRLGGQGLSPSPGTTFNYPNCGSKHRDRPVCVVLQHALGIDSYYWDIIFRVINLNS